MPIVTPTRIVERPTPILQREKAVVPPKPVAVDTKYETRRNLLTHVEGAKWVVTYYKQLKTKDEASEAFNINRPLAYQQYLKIENFELRVTSALQASPNNDESTHTVQGVSFVYPSIVPDHGDQFIADVGDGRSALFNIREVTQKSYLRDTVYEIEYDLVDWLDHKLHSKLEEKVVRTSYYERSYTDYGANPVLDEEQHGIFKKVLKWQEQIRRHYFSSFYNNEHSTFLIPGQERDIYDPFLVEFLVRLWSANDFADMMKVKVYNRDTSTNLNLTTIWDVIINNDFMMLYNCSKDFGAIPRQLFNMRHTGLGGLRYSRIGYIYHPIQMVNPSTLDVKLLDGDTLNLSSYYSSYSVPREFKLNIHKLPGIGFVHPSLREKEPIRDIKDASSFTTYVLSPEFYNLDVPNMSKVEKMIYDTLNEKDIDLKELYPIMKDIVNMPELERFYYIPVIYALSRVGLGCLSQ